MDVLTKKGRVLYKNILPADWKVSKIDNHVSKVGSGSTPRGGEAAYSDHGVPFIRSQNVNEDRLVLKGIRYISPQIHKKMSGSTVRSQDVLLNITGASIGRSCIVPKDFIEGNVNQHVCIIRTTQSLFEAFLHYFLSSDIGQIAILKAQVGGNREGLNHANVRSLKIPLPPLPEQRAIAQVLSSMDKAINANNQLIAQKELRKKWLMQNLLTGKKRLKGFSGEWKKVGAGELFKSFTQKGFENEELLSATQDRGIIPRNQLEGRVTMPSTGIKGYKLVEPGDFIISLRSFQGGLEYSNHRGVVSPAYTVLKPKEEINDEFYKQYYKSYEFIGRLATAVIGIRDGKQISYNDYCIVKIPHPSLEEQTAIAQVLQAADKELDLLRAKTDKLKEQKKGMMQVLLTGKKRLKL